MYVASPSFIESSLLADTPWRGGSPLKDVEVQFMT